VKDGNSLMAVLLIIGGVVLVYAAVKGVDPRDLFKKALGGNNNG
jgi:hypothetical protein